MKKALVLVLGIGVVLGLLVLAGCAQTEDLATEEHEEEGSFRVEVSRNGFNDMAQGFQIEVEEGQEVEITFIYGDGDFSQNNPHQIIIPEYGIETEVLDENNPEVTVHFTATGHGDIIFMCAEAECIGHSNLVNGKIVIGGDEHADEDEDS